MIAPRIRLLVLALLPLMAAAVPARARADDRRTEAPDPTRLDVERLPPEAIQVTRDMYSRGLYLTADLGARGMAGGAGRISVGGPYARLGGGYEITPWLAAGAAFGFSFHGTDAPPPPAASAFQLYTLLAQLKFQLALGTRVALWLGPEIGIGWASGDFLQAWGLRDAGKVAATYGAELGFDWHLMNAHHSLGLAVGTLLDSNLDSHAFQSSTDRALILHGSAYLKYVF